MTGVGTDRIFLVTTEFVQARILLSQQRILCREKVLAKPDELCRDRMFWVATEPVATENFVAHDRARLMRHASACNSVHDWRLARATAFMASA